jgi:SAGA-associated factor 29
MKNEQRISPYFKQKLQGLYQAALQDAKRELVQVEQALDKVAEIRQEIGEKQSRPATQPLNFEDIQARKSGMRRGMLMTVLQQYAQEQDVWRGKPGESIPPLTGAIPADEKHKCKPEDQVYRFRPPYQHTHIHTYKI